MLFATPSAPKIQTQKLSRQRVTIALLALIAFAFPVSLAPLHAEPPSAPAAPSAESSAAAPTNSAPVSSTGTVPSASSATTSSATTSAAGESASPLSFATAPALTNPGLTKRDVLANGLTLVTQVDQTSPRVSISVLVRAGASDETPETAGWRRLLAEAMLRATQNNGATQSNGAMQTFAALNRRAAELGGRLGASVSDDAIEFSVTGESRGINALLDLLLTVLSSPRLADEDVQAARQILAARRESTADDVTTLATSALGAQLFQDAAGQPLAYGLPTLGSAVSLQSLSSPRLRALHRRFFRPERITIGAIGDLDTIDLRARLHSLSLLLPPATTTENVVDPVTANRVLDVAPLFAPRVAGKPLVISQVSVVPGDWVFVSYRLGLSSDADAPALAVLVAALGASPNASLSRRLLQIDTNSKGKTKLTQPLAQQASAALTARRFGGDLTVFALTGAATTEQLRQSIADAAKLLRDNPMSESELAAARCYAIGDWMTSGEALHDRAFRLASEELLGIAQPDATWPVRLQNVGADDVQRAAQKVLNNEAVVIVRAVG